MTAATYELLFDTVARSPAPRTAAIAAAALAAAVALRAGWLTTRERPWLDPLTVFLALVTALLAFAAGAYAYEKRRLAGGALVPRTVEGPITALWHDRTVRGGRTTAYWEGFRVADVPFVYEQGMRDNYWHNRPDQGGPLGAGARVRLHYLEREEGGRLRRHIVRVERLVP